MSEIIACQQLTKSFGSTKALDALDLTLNTGAPIALVGPNGAGKTTLLSLLCGYIAPTSGSAKILGQVPGHPSLVGQVSALPQDAEFDPSFRVGRQLQFFARLQGMTNNQANDDTDRVLHLVQMQDSADKKAGALSHGMRKRVALAQALLGKPALVMLDEPTAGIDPPNVKIIRDLVRSKASDTTFLISSHNLDELEKLCDSVVYLSQGKLVQSGALDAETDRGFLTVSAPNVPQVEFLAACRDLEGVMQIDRQAQGDFLIQYNPETAVDQALLAMLQQRGWRYRHLINGRSLEERLYG